MAKAGRGWPELTKTPALAGIITQPELKTPALAGIQNPARLAGIESAKIRPWPGIHSASCKYLELNLQNQKTPSLAGIQNPTRLAGIDSAKSSCKNLELNL